MAERLAYLEAVIGADITQFRKGMRDIRNETGILSETMRGVSGLGRTLTFAYTTPLLVLGSAAVNVASDFDAAMQNINAIAGLTGDELDNLSQRTLEFGKTTRAGAIGSAEALYTVFSSGLTDVTQAFATMEIASMTAEAGLANVNTTTEALVGSMLAYGDTSEENANRTSDALTQMVALGVGSMENFANSIATVTPAAVGLGVSIEELYADVAFLTQQGFSAARATTALNSSFTALSKPTEAMSAAMSRLGARGAADLIERFGGVNEAMVALVETTDGSQEAINALFGNIRGSRAVSTFMNNLDAWRDMTAEFEDTVGGATLRAWESQMDSFAATSDKFKSAIQGLGIVIGQALFPVLTPVLKGLTDFINRVSSGNPKIIAMATAFIGLSAAIPPVLWLLGSLVTPIGLVVAGVGMLATAFATDFAGIRTTVSNAVSGILDDLMPLWDSITSFWELLTGEAPQFQPFDLTAQPLRIQTDDIIQVDEPKSLWQIYEEEGYADRFSWQAFIEEATAGGWMGGAVTPDTPIRITPEVEVDFSGSAADMPIDPHLAALIPPDAIIAQGIQMGADALPDEQQTPLQRAIDNMGAQIETQFDELLPRVGDAFMGFLEGVVPQLSSGIGWAAGKISAFLFEKIVDGIEYVFSGEAAGDTGTIVSDVVTWINDNIVTPFSDEFMAAIEGTELQTAIDTVTTFIDDIKNAFSLGDAGVDLSGFTDLTDGIKNAITDLSEADWSGVAKLGVIVGLIAGAAFSTAINILSGLSSGLGLIIESLGAGLASIVNALAVAGDGDLAGGLALLGGALIDFGIALLQIPVGIIDTLAGAILGLFGLDVPSIGDWLNGIREDIDAAIDGWIDNRHAQEINPRDFLNFQPMETEDALNLVNDAMMGALGTIGTEKDEFGMFDVPVSFTLSSDFSFENTNFARQAVQNLVGLISDADTDEATRLLAQGVLDTFANELEAAGIAIPPDAFNVPSSIRLADGTVIEVNNPEVVISTAGFGNDFVIPQVNGAMDVVPTRVTFGSRETLPTDTPLTVQPTQPVNMTGVSFAFSEAMMSGEDTQSIIDTNLIPLETAWVAMFSAEGLMATTFGTFSSGVTIGWADMDTGTNTFVDNVTERLPEASGVFETETPRWTSALSPFIETVTIARDTVNELKSAIEALLNLEGELSISVTVEGTANGTSLATGLDYVPYDEYPAVLHKGERVMTAEENKAFMAGEDRNMSVNAILPRDVGSGGSSSSTSIYVQSKLTVDGFIAEMKRRGYNIEK